MAKPESFASKGGKKMNLMIGMVFRNIIYGVLVGIHYIYYMLLNNFMSPYVPDSMETTGGLDRYSQFLDIGRILEIVCKGDFRGSLDSHIKRAEK